MMSIYNSQLNTTLSGDVHKAIRDTIHGVLIQYLFRPFIYKKIVPDIL